MATKKTGRYRVLREFDGHAPGDFVADLDPERAALLIRDGMITEAEES